LHKNIVRTIVSLAHNLHMEDVAEGVETAEQVHLLTRMDCDSGQRYYSSRTLIAEDIEGLLAASPEFRILLAQGATRS
jgi:EAL domain-containing protein (putative c-di-GMP-specific phosphodiesterase class I)